MSGSFQQVPVNYQAWAPPSTLPNIQTPRFITPNAQPTTGGRTKALNSAIDSWWNIPTPMPVIPALDALNLGAGPSFGIFHSAQVVNNAILAAWIAPDPLPTLPQSQLHKFFTPSAPPGPPPPVPGNLATPPHGVAPNGAVPVYITTNGVTNGAVPRAGTANTVVNAGVAIVVATGPLNGGYITNPLNAAAQGIVTAEDINIDMTAPPLAGDAYGYGTTVTIPAGQTFTIPTVAAGVQIWVNAATAGHRVTIVIW